MRSVFILLLITVSLFFSCDDECLGDNVKLGEVTYSEETQSFLNYVAGETLEFINENGQTKTFQVTQEENLMGILCVKVTCRPAFEFDGMNGCEYYEAESDYWVLQSDDIFLHFKAGIEMYNAETENFYDFIEAGFTGETSNLFAGLITSSNFTSPTINISNTILSDTLSFEESTTLGNFENVYIFRNEENEDFIILDKLKGILKFSINSESWTLKE